MEKIVESFISWINGNVKGPLKLQLNPTNRCNLKCRFCWLRDYDSKPTNYDEVDRDRYLEIIEEANDLGVNKIEITGGGEPFCRSDILDIMERIKSYNIFGELITNGTLFNNDSIKKIIDIGWDRIVFSLDAPDAETHDYLRGVSGSFEKTAYSIKEFIKHTDDMKKSLPELCVHMVLCNENHDKISTMFEFVNSLGIDNLFIEPIVLLAPETNSGNDLMIDSEHKKKLLLEIEDAIEIATKYGFKTNIDKLRLQFIENVNKMDKFIISESVRYDKNSLLSIPCYYPWYQMIIRPWGSVGPCCMFDNIGENIKEKSLHDIWYGDYFEKMRDILKKNKLPKFCSKCNPSQVQENNKIREFLKRYERRKNQ